MEKQKGKGGIDSSENVVDQLRTSLSHIKPVLIDSFGCDGLAVLIQKSNGNLLLTKSGLEIVENLLSISTCNSRSVETFFSHYCKRINITVGDGIKRFTIYVNTLITLLQIDKNLISKRLKQLEILQYILNQSKIEWFTNREIQCTISKIKLEHIIKSFMATRFTLSVAITFSELVFNWMTSFYSNDYVSDDKIKLLLKYVNVLCVQNSEATSLSESKVQSGFLIKGKINNFYKNVSGLSCVLKVFVYDSEDKNLDDLKIFESDVIRLIAEIDFENIGNVIKILLVTNVSLSDSLLFYLRKKNVISAEGLEIDDVIFLNGFLLKHHMCQEFTTDFRYVNDTTIWISLCDISQLILCTPKNDLWLQLYGSLRNLITLIDYSLTDKIIIYDVDSTFEQLIYNLIFKTCENVGRQRPPLFISNRKELTDWNSRRADLIDENRSNNKILSDSLLKGDITNEHTKHFTGFISYLVECIISKNELKDDSFVTFLCDLFYYILKIFKLKEYSSDCRFIYLELVAVKLGILNYAIDFILHIFKIGLVVKAKRQINLPLDGFY